MQQLATPVSVHAFDYMSDSVVLCETVGI